MFIVHIQYGREDGEAAFQAGRFEGATGRTSTSETTEFRRATPEARSATGKTRLQINSNSSQNMLTPAMF